MISIVTGDIAATRANAIMRPVSAEWDPVTAATRRLEVVAGQTVAEQCARLGTLPIGSAVITGAGGAPADFMVHVVVRSITEPVSESVVQRALQNGLRRCVEWGIETVAMPPIGTGAGNLDAEQVAELMIPVLFEHMQSARYPSVALVVTDSEYERNAFAQVITYHDLPLLPEDRR